MSFLVTATAYVGYNIYQGERARRDQSRAQADAKRAARKNARDADIAFNAANRKAPKIPQVAQSAKGIGSTMLTGPQGLDTSQLLLGRSTLLGS